MIKVGKLSATTSEQFVVLGGGINSNITIIADADTEISINDNLNYQTYKTGEIIPLHDRKGKIDKLYFKTLTGTATVRYWLM